MSSEHRREWYRDGLRFSCTQCGNCCSGSPGRVWFDGAELKRMARRLGVLPFEFLARFTRQLDGRNTLIEVERDGQFDCVFLRRDDAGKATCAIYEDRPQQCRTWPFWPDNLRSRAAWNNAAKRCPGMQDDAGQQFSAAEIDRRRDATPMP